VDKQELLVRTKGFALVRIAPHGRAPSNGELLPKSKLSDLLKEADELTAIFTAGRRSSTRSQTSNLKPQTSQR
jgi:hypothetical protein